LTGVVQVTESDSCWSIDVQIPQSIQPLFVAAGWQSNRRVPVNPNVPVGHPAHDILSELGGLHVGQRGPGIECATSDVKFDFCDGDSETVDIWSRLLEARLVGVAELDKGYGWLLVDASGRCFGADLVSDNFYFYGATFDEAVERLLAGRRARPVIRPDQDQVYLYGENFTRGHPALFDFRR
jgi:hypothetical protein